MGQSNDKIAIKYYKSLSDAKTVLSVPTKESKELLRLSIKLENAEAGHYQYQAYQIENDELKLLESSEELSHENNEVTFKKTVHIKHYFEKEQLLKFIIQRKGNAETTLEYNVTLGNIIVSKNTTIRQPIDSVHNEIINIKVFELKDDQQYMNFHFEVQPNNIKFKKHKYRFNYVVKNEMDLYQSETISRQGTFNASHIPTSLLAPKFTIDFFDYKSKLINQINASLNEFLDKNGRFQTISVTPHKKKQVHLINKSELKQSFSFIDYLRSGVKIGLSFAIDFTRSNGEPSDPKSLHYISEGQMNPYEKVMYSCGNIIKYYNCDQKFSVYGFGANLPGESIHSMCFPINGNPNDPEIHTVDKVIEQYHQIMQSLDFSGPTYFGPILRETIKNIKKEKESNHLKYTILMILTDGMINDMNECIDLLVKGANLPLSVIIVGIGNFDFGQMEMLNVGDNPLISNEGERCCRDLVQFVTFNKFQNDGMALAEKVLEAIPKQIIEYYSKNNIFPSEHMEEKVHV